MLVRVVLGTLGCWFLPGFAATRALFPKRDDLSPLECIVLSVGLSIVLVVATGLILAKCGLFGSDDLWAALVVESAVLGAMGLARGYQPTLRFGRTLFSGTNRKRLVIVLVAVLSILLPHVYEAVRYPFPTAQACWYYIADTAELVRTERIPETSREWGTQIPFDNNKISFYLFVGAWLQLSGLSPVIAVAIKFFTLLALLTAVAATWLWLRGLVRFEVSVAMLVVFFWTPLFIHKFSDLRGETFGILLLLISLWMMHRGLLGGESRFLWCLAPLLATAASSHGVPAVVGLFFFVALVLGRWAQDRQLMRQEAIPVGMVLAATVVLTLAIFFMASSSEQWITNQESTLKQEPLATFHGYDPTYEFVTHAGLSRIPPHRYVRDKTESLFYASPGALAGELLRQMMPIPRLGVRLPSIDWPVPALIGLAVPVIAMMAAVLLLSKDGIKRTYVLSSAAFFVLLYLWALLFSAIYDTYLPAMHPSRREFQYAFRITLLLAAIAFEVGLQVLVRYVKRAKTSVPRCVYGLTAVGVIVGFLVPGVAALDRSHYSEDTVFLSPEGIRALTWLEQNTPRDALILPNLWTSGAVEVLGGRESLLEGVAPYLQPRVLDHALGLLEEARCFFADPLQVTLLKRYDVDYVMVIPDREFDDYEKVIPTRELGGYGIARRGLDQLAFATLPYFEDAAVFGDIRIYRVHRDRLPGPDLVEGRRLLSQQRWDESVDCLTRALTREEDAAWANEGLARAYYAQGNVERALEHAQRALENKPDNAWLHSRLGSLHLAAGEPYEAISHYEFARRMAPGDRGLLLDLAAANAAVGNPEAAVALYAEVFRLTPADELYHSALASVRAECGDQEGGTAAYYSDVSMGLEEWPHIRLGDLAWARGDLSDAFLYYKEATATRWEREQRQIRQWHVPEVEPYGYLLDRWHLHLAKGYQQDGQLDQAIIHYRKALWLDR